MIYILLKIIIKKPNFTVFLMIFKNNIFIGTIEQGNAYIKKR